MNKRFHYLYRTTCTATGKFYIGVHSTDDLDDGYLGSGLHLQRSVKKYGAAAHKREILNFFQGREALLEAESGILTGLQDALCMNIAEGGGDPPRRYGPDHHLWGGGEKVSAATREKLRFAKLGTANAAGPHKMTEEGRKRIAEAASRTHKGKPRSEETRERMRLAQLNRPAHVKRACVVAHLRKNKHYVPCRINLIAVKE